MKGLLLALFCFLIFLFLSVPLIRWYRGRKEFQLLSFASFWILILYSSLYRIFPKDLGFLPQAWLTTPSWADYANSLVILTFLCVGFSQTIYNAFMEGLSFTLLIKLLHKGEAGITLAELEKNYPKAISSQVVFETRLTKMTRGHYISEEDKGRFKILPKGILVGRLVKWLQQTLNIKQGG